MRDTLLRSGYRVAYRLLTVSALVRRRRGRGVKCVLAHGDSIVLVRHTYGPRRMWHIPGGGIHRGESTLDAAAREMREELGLDGIQYRLLGQLELRLDHRRVRVGAVHAELSSTALTPDPIEIAEARFFALDALPSPVGAEVRDLVALAFTSGASGERPRMEE